ncbi:hypothetical protein [Luteolibacter soli]|uniref:DUF3108 domain-containing protein n=1 Tax=Luteolibacter soli TaxID=3135280 RepID=A0ABU9AX33_9BACT
MIHLRPLVTTAALLLSAPIVSAQDKNKDKSEAIPMDTHVLATQGAAPALGTTFTITRIIASDGMSMKMSSGGKLTEGTVVKKETTVETLEGLGPGKMRRTLMSTGDEGTVTFNGQASRPPRRLDSLLETPVILTRAKGSWIADLEKGPAFENQKRALQLLEQTVNRDFAFTGYGSAPHKPGDKWNASLEAFGPELFGEFANAKDVKGTFTLELTGIKQQLDTPCAQLKATFDLKGTPKGDPTGTFTFKGEGDILRSLRDQVDLGWKYTAVIDVSAKGAAPGQPSMQVSGPLIITGTTTVKRP